MLLHLLRDGQLVLRTMSQDLRIREVAAPALLHQDLNVRNIIVSQDDPTITTCFIDWQSTSLSPVFSGAVVRPDFAVVPARSDHPADFNVVTYPDARHSDFVKANESYLCRRARHLEFKGGNSDGDCRNIKQG
jgi:hypothetical protein